MHRTDLLQRLQRYQPSQPEESQCLRETIAFVSSQPRCFERSLTSGHMTGSAWLLSPDGSQVLLTHHRKLNRWLQLGGHADGDSNLLAVALREAQEESGIPRIEPVHQDIFDLDVHWIPPRANEPGHYHYDIRFLLRCVDSTAFICNEESHELRWFTLYDFPLHDVDAAMQRMHGKWRVWLTNHTPVTQP